MSDTRIAFATRGGHGLGRWQIRTGRGGLGFPPSGSYQMGTLVNPIGLVHEQEVQIAAGQDTVTAASGSFEIPAQLFVSFHFPKDYWSWEEIAESLTAPEEVKARIAAPRVELSQTRGLNICSSGGTSLSSSFAALLLAHAMRISTEVAAKARELLSLDAGWDGDDAKPVRTEALARAIMVLGMLKRARSGFLPPFIAPTFEGSVLLDWVGPSRTLELEPKGTGWSVVGTMTPMGSKKEYLSAYSDQDETRLLRYYEWFRDELLLWPTD
jgi:hypothetical protein